jgi:hypothetical protein
MTKSNEILKFIALLQKYQIYKCIKTIKLLLAILHIKIISIIIGAISLPIFVIISLYLPNLPRDARALVPSYNTKCPNIGLIDWLSITDGIIAKVTRIISHLFKFQESLI